MGHISNGSTRNGATRATETDTDLTKSVKSMKELAYNFSNIVEVAQNGIVALREANAKALDQLREAKEEAKVAVTDQKVYDFMDKTLMSYGSARTTLEAAYVDDVCPNVKDPNDN